VLAGLQVATPYLVVFLVLGPWGKTSIIPDPKAGMEENQTRERRLAELRDFIAFHSGGNALVVTYKAIEDRFIGLPGIRTGHFNAIAGLDIFGDVRSLFVIGRPLPEPDVLRHMALALTGKFIARENPEVETLGQRVADGSGAAIKVRRYANPDLEALRLAITDAEVLQAAGRGRAVNRTAETPLTMFIMADVVVPMPVRRIARWADMRLSAHQRMAARGLVSDSPTDAARLYPDLFPSAEAAKKALQRVISGTFPYEENLIGKCPRNRVIEGRYRPQGRGQQLRLIAVAEWRLPQARDDLEAILGPLGVFELAPTPAIDGTTPRSSQAAETPAITLPDPIALAVMADVDKLTIRAHLQASCAPLSPDAAASELLGGYGEGSPPGELLRGWRITAPKASSWKIWRRTQGPLTAEELSDDPLIIMLMEPQATSTAV
jgi:putative DNA primase/helicase